MGRSASGRCRRGPALGFESLIDPLFAWLMTATTGALFFGAILSGSTWYRSHGIINREREPELFGTTVWIYGIALLASLVLLLITVDWSRLF